jgi:hypothetical protein
VVISGEERALRLEKRSRDCFNGVENPWLLSGPVMEAKLSPG